MPRHATKLTMQSPDIDLVHILQLQSKSLFQEDVSFQVIPKDDSLSQDMSGEILSLGVCDKVRHKPLSRSLCKRLEISDLKTRENLLS